MKLIRFGAAGNERPGVIINEKRYDVSEHVSDYDEDFFANDGLSKLHDVVANNQLSEVSNDERLGCPVKRPSKIICIGLNYADHATESNMDLPKEPVVFFKSTTAIVGPDDDLIIPRDSIKTDWEVELAVVIGKKTSYITEDEAMDHIAGYLLHNDYSERAFQLERSGQWVKGKSCDTFAPLGPWLATKDEIADINKVRLWLKVNGQMMQDGTTERMVFKVTKLVSYLSEFMTLLPGDIISTGTPAGVGLAQKPQPVYIKEGDVIELGIDGLGTQKQTARAWSRQ